ncbi:MAG TPA: hypothetical protein VN538_12365 [Clostridia bacterium]|nr:hypothetical protein [Clostridia bacterium]
MQVHRKSIICTSTICFATLVLAILLTCFEKYFLLSWFTFLISLTIGVFASSLIMLANSLVAYPVLRKACANTSIQLLSEILEKHAELEMLVVEVKSSSNSNVSSNPMQVFDSLLMSQIRSLKNYIGSERIAWPSTTKLTRILKIHKSSLALTEAQMVVCCFEALQSYSKCHVNFAEFRLYEGDKQAEALKQFVDNWREVFMLFSKTGDFLSFYNKYIELVAKV